MKEAPYLGCHVGLRGKKRRKRQRPTNQDEGTGASDPRQTLSPPHTPWGRRQTFTPALPGISRHTYRVSLPPARAATEAAEGSGTRDAGRRWGSGWDAAILDIISYGGYEKPTGLRKLSSAYFLFARSSEQEQEKSRDGPSSGQI